MAKRVVSIFLLVSFTLTNCAFAQGVGVLPRFSPATLAALPNVFQNQNVNMPQADTRALEARLPACGFSDQLKELSTSENGKWHEYDGLDQLVSATQYLTADHLPLTTIFSYDANGNRIKVIDAQGNQTRYEYDALDRLKTVIDALGNSTQYSYDANGNLQNITDAKNNATAYEYDGFDRLITTTYPDASYETLSYDADSNLLSKTTRKGDVINFAYDALNRLTQKVYPDATSVSYSYDIASRVSSVTGANGAINYAYDNLNRVTQTTTQGKAVGYEYDKSGNRTKLIYPDNTFITYDYDALNRLTTIKDQTTVGAMTNPGEKASVFQWFLSFLGVKEIGSRFLPEKIRKPLLFQTDRSCQRLKPVF